jgi:branched-chain amino acid transport system permease protein
MATSRSAAELVWRSRPLLLLIAVLVAIAIATRLVGGTVLDQIVTVLFINVILVLGLQSFVGNSGLLSFAHIGFMGIGAYLSAIMTMGVREKAAAMPDLYEFLVPIQLPFIPALLIAAVVAAVVAGLVGFPLMRLSDAASVISTFALLVIIHVVLSQWSEMTNGPRTVFGLLPYTDLATAATWAILFLVLVYGFKHSSVGLKLRASRDSEFAASTIGVDIVRLRWIAFVVSAFIVGFAGGLWAHFITSFAPAAFYLRETFVVLTMLIVGGPRTVSGAIVGTLLVTAVFEALRAVENTISLERLVPFEVVGLTGIALAIFLILILALRPGGLLEEREILTGRTGRVGRGLSSDEAGGGVPTDQPISP